MHRRVGARCRCGACQGGTGGWVGTGDGSPPAAIAFEQFSSDSIVLSRTAPTSLQVVRGCR